MVRNLGLNMLNASRPHSDFRVLYRKVFSFRSVWVTPLNSCFSKPSSHSSSFSNIRTYASLIECFYVAASILEYSTSRTNNLHIVGVWVVAAHDWELPRASVRPAESLHDIMNALWVAREKKQQHIA